MTLYQMDKLRIMMIILKLFFIILSFVNKSGSHRLSNDKDNQNMDIILEVSKENAQENISLLASENSTIFSSNYELPINHYLHVNEISSTFNSLSFNSESTSYFQNTPELETGNILQPSINSIETMLTFDPDQLTAVFQNMTLEIFSNSDPCEENNIIVNTKISDDADKADKFLLKQKNCKQTLNVSSESVKTTDNVTIFPSTPYSKIHSHESFTTIDTNNMNKVLVSSSVFLYSTVPSLLKSSDSIEMIKPTNLFTYSKQHSKDPVIQNSKTSAKPNENKNKNEDPSEDNVTNKPNTFPTKFPKVIIQPSVPSLYLRIRLNTELCNKLEDFKHIIAKIIEYSSKIIINPNQVVLTNIENHCLQSNSNSKVVVDMFMVNDIGGYDSKFTEAVFHMLVKNNEVNEEIPYSDKFINIDIIIKEDEFKTLAQSSVASSGILAAVIISCIAGVCILGVIVLQIFWKKNHWPHFAKKRCTPADSRSMDLASIRSSIRMKKFLRSHLRRSYINKGFDDPETPNRILNKEVLFTICNDLEFLDQEFKKIPMNMPKIDELVEGLEDKNRYANVIPIMETRVILSLLPEVLHSDYINANFVRGYKNKDNAYIACQAPLDNTIYDFWRMVMECKSEVIVMLTAFEEQGLSRCARYFPTCETIDSTKDFGNISVTIKKKDMKEYFVLSHLKVENQTTKESIEVHHFWFNTWPEQGMPEEAFSVISFLQEARPALDCSRGPPIFHCSTGIGRTGVILACDICMRQFEESHVVNIVRSVYRLRQDRGGAIQTKQQYQFVYKVLAEYAKSFHNQVNTASDSASISISSEY